MRDRIKPKEFDKTKRQGSGNRSDRKSVKRRDQQSTMQGAQIWLPNIGRFIIPLVGYWKDLKGAQGQRNTASYDLADTFSSPFTRKRKNAQ